MNNNTDYAALVLRVGMGTMFVAHGLLKILVFTLPGRFAVRLPQKSKAVAA